MSLLTARTTDLAHITSLSDAPRYNIKAVVQKTQIQTSTLRAWERRYGIPKPERSDHGHRLYSARDLALLTWLRERVDEGMAISHAVAMVQQVAEPTAPACPAAALPAPNSVPTVPDPAAAMARLREHLVRAITRFDAPQAHALVSHAYACYPLESVVLDLFAPVLSELGARWMDGCGTIAEEHFGSSIIRQRLLGMVQVCAPVSLPQRMLCACPTNERHELGLLMFALLVQQQGWEVFYLGQDTGLDGLAACMTQVRPDVVCASVSMVANLPGLVQMGRMVEATPLEHRPIFAYGGAPFLGALPNRHTLPGIYLGGTLPLAVATVTQLVSAPLAISR